MKENLVFSNVPEPHQSSLLFLRKFFKEEIGLEERIKFNTPFYYYRGKWFAYLSYNAKRNHEIYIGFIKGFMIQFPNLESEGRKQVKLFRINGHQDIDVTSLEKISELLKDCYK
jgi:hypothetical protein